MMGPNRDAVLIFLVFCSTSSAKVFESDIDEEITENNGLLTPINTTQGSFDFRLYWENTSIHLDLGGYNSSRNSETPIFSDTSLDCWVSDNGCSGRCDLSSHRLEAKVRENALCSCDKLCVLFGDCCFDFLGKCYNLTQDRQSEIFLNVLSSVMKHVDFGKVNGNVPQSQTLDIPTSCFATLGKLFTLEKFVPVQGCFECKTLKIKDKDEFKDKFLNLLTKCPLLWEENSIKAACEYQNRSLFNTPVQNRNEPAIIYRNIHCAFCHGKEFDDVTQWSSFVSCLNEDELAAIIRHSSDKIEDYIEGNCEIAYTPSAPGWTRAECPYNHKFKALPMIGISNTTGTYIETKMCQLYFQPVSQESNKTRNYRNAHCARLDGVHNFCCSDKEIMAGVEGSSEDFSTVVRPLSVLFNFRDSSVGIQYDGEVIHLSSDDNKKCSGHEVYNFLNQRCERNLAMNVLAQTNISIRIDARVLAGTCDVLASNIEYVLSSTLFFDALQQNCVAPGGTQFKLTTLQENVTYVTNQEPIPIVGLLLMKLKDVNIETATSRIACGWWHIDYNEMNSARNQLGKKGIGVVDYCEMKLDILVESEDLAWETFVILLKNLNESIGKYSGFFYNLDRGVILAFENIRVTNQDRISRKTCLSEDISYTIDEENPWTLIIDQEPSRNINLRNSAFLLDHWFGSNSSNSRQELKIYDNVGIRGLDEFYNCDAVLSVENITHWTQYENLYISINLNVFRFGKYQELNGTMYYCADSGVKVPGVLQDNSVLTIVSLSLSLVALLFVIMTYAFFSPLRNLPGKIILGLTSSLFCAMLLFLFGTGRTKYPVLCTIMAALLHFFWLASFFWTTVLSFNLAQTFGSKTMTVGYERNRFLHYCTYPFAGPLLIVLVTLLEGFFHKPDFWVHGSYGSAAACWISQRWVNIVAFCLPVGLTVLLNTALFVYTVRGLYKISKITKCVRNKENRGQSTILYFKLSLIMGLSWALFYLSEALENELLQALSIVLNALQGFFLFLVFVCSKRVYNLYKDVFHSFIMKEQKFRAENEAPQQSRM